MQELSLHTEIPIAVDEIITDIDSVHRILEYQCADVFVLKPMISLPVVPTLYDKF